jgi:hypothetical protein
MESTEPIIPASKEEASIELKINTTNTPLGVTNTVYLDDISELRKVINVLIGHDANRYNRVICDINTVYQEHLDSVLAGHSVIYLTFDVVKYVICITTKEDN